MPDTMSHWIKTFTDCELPVLYKSKHRLYELQENEQDITVTVLAEIARQDPGFSISILRHAGRSKKKEITTLSHAISLISIPLVIKMLTDLQALEKTLDKKTVSKIMNTYSFLHQTAYMAKEWSILRKESENNEIFTAGLNRGFLRFMLYLIDPDKAIELEKIYLTPDDNHKTKEKELLGNNVDAISEAIAKSWKLPELICESFSGKHHNPKITGIRLATELIHHIHTYSSIQYPEELIERIATYIRTPLNLAPGKINKIIVGILHNSHGFLPKQPLLRIFMSYPASINKPLKPIIDSSYQRKKILSECIKLIRSDTSEKTNKQLIDLSLKALREGGGFSRVLFMSFQTNENQLKLISRAFDNDIPDIKQLSIDLDLNKIFQQLLKKEQLLSITSKNQHKYNDLLPKALRPLTSSATIIVNSFYIKDKPVGCFFVDHGKKVQQLTSNDLKLFRFICAELKAGILSSLNNKRQSKKVA